MWRTHTQLYLHGGCHGFLSKALGIMAHPLVMSALEESGGRKELKEGEGEERGGEGRRRRCAERRGGSRQPVAHDH